MSAFIYSTETTMGGPWLIERNSLQQLGQIIETISTKFSNAAYEEIESKINKSLLGYEGEEREQQENKLRQRLETEFSLKKYASLTLSPTKYCKEETIEQILSSPDLLDEKPTALIVKVEAANRSAQISFQEQTLSIRTFPETDGLSREAFVELQQWAIGNSAPKWQRLWRENYGNGGILMLWGASLIISSFFIPDSTNDIHKSLMPDAVQLLKDGISNDEVPKAIEILLRAEFKIPLVETTPNLPIWYKFVLYGGIAALLLLYFRPPLLLGIGRNVQRIQFWRNWGRFIGFTLPGFIFISIIWPYVSSIIGLPH